MAWPRSHFHTILSPASVALSFMTSLALKGIVGVRHPTIGTPHGTSVYVTASKDLQHWTGLPIAPYGGVVWGSYEKKFRAIGGLNMRLPYRLTSLIQFDGVKVHPSVTYTFNDTHALTFLMIRGTRPGVTYTFSF